MRQLEVYVNEVKAGLLTELNPGKGYTFAYYAEYVATSRPMALILNIAVAMRTLQGASGSISLHG